jgi:predicted chitinase
VLKSRFSLQLNTFQSAKFFFDTNKLWTICKTIDDNYQISKKINGGTNGLADRIDKQMLAQRKRTKTPTNFSCH